jgi:hypothetical protein
MPELGDDISPIPAGNGKAMKGKVRLLSRQQLDGRTKAAKVFDSIRANIAADLGGHDRLTTVQGQLIEAFAGIAVHVNSLNARLLLGEEVNINAHATACSTLVRIASRIGLGRVGSRRHAFALPVSGRGGPMIPKTTLRRALADQQLLGSELAGDSWAAWRTLLIAAMGEELTDDERQIFRQLTGRHKEPGECIEELRGCRRASRRQVEGAVHARRLHCGAVRAWQSAGSGRDRRLPADCARSAPGQDRPGLLRGSVRAVAHSAAADCPPDERRDRADEQNDGGGTGRVASQTPRSDLRGGTGRRGRVLLLR